MRLAAGVRLGPYEVLALLGAGGMAEVYRARDTRLGREVAVKVVSEALGADGAFVEFARRTGLVEVWEREGPPWRRPTPPDRGASASQPVRCWLCEGIPGP
jgi:Serine/threonine protein kinase